ncbi:MAG: hypothetical protein KAR06_12905 [Deltaproteobacteria bacterium]|nr:hypothetical protein [Deltaproteobacteria bacterium]
MPNSFGILIGGQWPTLRGYVFSNPRTFTDPSGLATTDYAMTLGDGTTLKAIGDKYYICDGNNLVSVSDRWIDLTGTYWYKDPSVQADLVALVADLSGQVELGNVASVGSTLLTYTSWQEGDAEVYDLIVSVVTTVVGQGKYAVPVDLVILTYDIIRAEMRGAAQ